MGISVDPDVSLEGTGFIRAGFIGPAMPLEAAKQLLVANAYDQFFSVVRADTDDLLDAAYRLRYQVYCVENPFENPREHREEREIDGEDDRSDHCVLIYRRTGLIAGTVRLILPAPNPQDRPLPVDRILSADSQSLFRRLLPVSTAEISRFAVSKQFRRRIGEHRYADVGFTGTRPNEVEQRLMPWITFGLLRGILAMSLEHGITHLCAVMEPALLRLIGRLGLTFQPLGPLVEYHGLRQPCFMALAEVLPRVHDLQPDLWAYAAADQVGSFPPAATRLSLVKG